jgi:hypothetical protein
MATACPASNAEDDDESPSGSQTSGGPSGTGGGLVDPGTGGGFTEPPCDPANLAADGDQDGWSPNDGDCNDCTPMMNPGAYDYPNNAIDEDCNNTDDDEPTDCDGGLAPAGDDAMDAARAIDLCRVQSGESWGVVSARWNYPDGTDMSVSMPGGCVLPQKPPNPQSRQILTEFGSAVSPRAGSAMAAISSGVAKPGDHPAAPPGMGTSPGGAQMCVGSNAPQAFPQDSPACPIQTSNDKRAFDAMALELEIKTPTNALSMSFDFDFYTYEWPGFVCTQFNDFFVALLESQHPSTPSDKNVSFDSEGNPVSVNNGLVQVCDPAIGMQSPGGKFFACDFGTAELAGTGFEPDHAATSWLVTTVNVVPGEVIKLRLGVWDMGDEILDSTVLIDNVRWDLEPGGEGPSTEPVK